LCKRYKIQANPRATNTVAINLKSKFPFGKITGVKAMPTLAKNATTQEVHPNVNNPKTKDNRGTAFDPATSFFVNE
jgi:hypothetical protein